MNGLLRFFRLLLKSALKAVIIIAISGIVLLVSVYIIIETHFDGSGQLPADCAIVFGAAVYGNKYPSPAISRRVEAAARLYQEGSVRRLIMSGGKGKVSDTTEADVMRDVAMQNGVPSGAIIMEDRARSTWENIVYARNLTSTCSSVVGISDQYHLARIELIAWRQDWELKTIPAEDRPPLESERRSVLREVFAYIFYLFYIDTLYPDLPTRIQ